MHRSLSQWLLVGTLAAPLEQQVTIVILPDEALLEVFEFYLVGCYREEWFTLAHVCQRWRCLVSASPCRLNLRLVCTGYTPPGEMLGRWPTLPIVIQYTDKSAGSRANNIVAALKHKNRVSKIKLCNVTNWQFEVFVTEMQEPFPKLEYLEIEANRCRSLLPVLPDSFLGGSAPLLADVHFEGILFLDFPKVFLSANNLCGIFLLGIPQFFSLEKMAAALSATNHLQLLEIQAKSWHPLQESQRSHPITRIVLPALFWLRLECTGDYLQNFMARMDALPALQWMVISLRHSLVFDIPELPQFISRINAFKISDQASICTYPDEVRFTFSQKIRTGAELTIIFTAASGTISSLLPVCCSSLTPHPFERLEIRQYQRIQPVWEVENELPGRSPRFGAVKNLFLNKSAAENAGYALKACPEERVTQMFPALQNIFLEELHFGTDSQKAIRRFASARRLAGLPVTLHNWEMGKEVGGQ